MVLKPEPMQRALIVASKAHQSAVIEALHSIRAAHFIEFQEQKEGEFAEFHIGKPLAHGEAASGQLVRVRALLRHLGLEGSFTEKTFPLRELETTLGTKLDGSEADVSRAVQNRESIRSALHEGKELEAKLAPLADLPLKLEDYTGYDALQVFAGRADAEWSTGVSKLAPDHILVTGHGELFALFVPKARAAEVSDLLYRHGFVEVEVPEGKGAPGERIREIQAERATLEGRLVKAESDLVRLAADHKDFLLAADEHLTILVEKAEAPLAFASSANAFIVDAWIPIASTDAVEAVVTTATGGNVHFARLETSEEVHEDHDHTAAHGDAHGGIDAGAAAHPAAPAPAPKSLPPTKFNNGKGTQSFEWFVGLFSTPRYNEIDPTLAFAIFFPLFFGFMIGDLGLGLLMVGLGFLVMKLKRVEGMPSLGRAILIAGIVAALLGGLVFKDALGIPLGFTHHMETELSAHGLALGCNAEVYTALHETNWGCLLGGNVWHVEPMISKVTDLNSMLLLSVLAAGVHLLVGLLFGLRNEMGHGAKHVAAKVGYLILLASFYPAVTALLRADMFIGGPEAATHAAVSFHIPLTVTQAYMGAGIGFVLGAVILGWAEGFGGVLEIPSMFSAIMSYLRLGAVAIAKGAMAVAFNALTLVVALEGLDHGNWLMFGLGLFGFLVAQMVLFVLGMLSGGIQALRLNFVEFFTKFYKGGGTPYKPFGRERVHTSQGGATSVAVSSIMLKP